MTAPLSAALLLASLAVATPAPAPPPTRAYALPDTEVRPFPGATGEADLLLYVSLPRGYARAADTYPVLLALDADYAFALLHQIARFLADHGELPPVVVAGIAYPGVAEEKYGPLHKTSRTRDYTPTRVAAGGYSPEIQKASGGGERFLDRLERDVLPWLEREYRIRPDDRGVVGYSYGGLLASYALLARPGLFRRAIVVSPSLWWDGGLPLRLAKAPSAKDLPVRAFFAVGGLETKRAFGTEMVGQLRTFVGRLDARRFPGFRRDLWVAPGETHHSVFPGAAMRGLRFVYGEPAGRAAE